MKKTSVHCSVKWENQVVSMYNMSVNNNYLLKVPKVATRIEYNAENNIKMF